MALPPRVVPSCDMVDDWKVSRLARKAFFCGIAGESNFSSVFPRSPAMGIERTLVPGYNFPASTPGEPFNDDSS
jgi:hypothetical protein